MKTKESLCGICNCMIKENTLFAALSGVEIDSFKDVIKTSFYDKKKNVFMEGDKVKGLYIVRVGRVKLVRSSKDGKEQIIKILYPGDILGLEAFHEGREYINSAVAMEDTDLCFIEKAAFFETLRKKPSVAVKLVESLGRELSHAYEKIGNLGLMNARERLAHLLYTLANEYGTPSATLDTNNLEITKTAPSEAALGSVRLNLNVSRLEIAELLGITQETSIRMLKSFKEEGLIKIKRKEIIITSLEKLKEITGIS